MKLGTQEWRKKGAWPHAGKAPARKWFKGRGSWAGSRKQTIMRDPRPPLAEGCHHPEGPREENHATEPSGTGAVVERDAQRCTMGVDKSLISLPLLSPSMQYP